ncbi:MAG: hypothetical protein ACK55I_42455, partial [bacterium]
RPQRADRREIRPRQRHVVVVRRPVAVHVAHQNVKRECEHPTRHAVARAIGERRRTRVPLAVEHRRLGRILDPRRRHRQHVSPRRQRLREHELRHRAACQERHARRRQRHVLLHGSVRPRVAGQPLAHHLQRPGLRQGDRLVELHRDRVRVPPRHLRRIDAAGHQLVRPVPQPPAQPVRPDRRERRQVQVVGRPARHPAAR